MAIALGTRLGPYEIVSSLGAGGMGEVYRARDSKLSRDVAVKVLLPAVAEDPERLTRFRREAQILAALNHQNIAQIHGFEDAGPHPALVMELVEGPTLAERLQFGALPLDEALSIARQIAEALEAAHEQGVIHRDLKPANLKVRDDGTVKVLDFGLAKALETADGRGHVADGLANSPTITSPARTIEGVILGTAAYMSPEQAKGKPVDKRADLWAFGCVVFEMLTGDRPFKGTTIAEVLAKVIEREPEWQTLPSGTPRSIRTLLRRCLEKDPKRRLDSAAAARLEIDEVSRSAASLEPNESLDGSSRIWQLRAVVAPALVGLIVGAIATWMVRRSPDTAFPAVSRFTVTPPATQALAFSINDRDVAISPDGSQLAFTGGDDARLMLRALDQLEVVPVPGIVNARAPFFSPDGQWIAFFDLLDEGVTTGPVVGSALRRVSRRGGPAVTVARLVGASRGASWGADDSIVFATSDRSTGLLRVAAGGGEPEVLTRPDTAKDEIDHFYPSPLPGGRAILFTITGRAGVRRIAAFDLESRQQRALLPSGTQAQYVDTGHLVYADGGALWTVGFDLTTISVVGNPIPIVEQVLTLGATAFALSRNGTLVYVPVSNDTANRLAWVTREGVISPIPVPPRPHRSPRISPDGTRIAVQVLLDTNEVWIGDIDGKRLSRLTFGRSGSYGPAWMRDGRHVIFGSPRDAPPERPGASNLYRRSVDGSGNDERLTTGDRQQRTNAVTPNGQYLVLEEQADAGGYDFMLLRLQGTPRVEALLQTPFDERNAEISPDGKWLAYESNESGQFQIYVRPFPNVTDGRSQVSDNGGRSPQWSPDGRELFFVSRTSMMTVPVQLKPTFTPGSPAKLFDARSLVLDGRFIGSTSRTFDISPDGQRFLMLQEGSLTDDGNRPSIGIVVVQNWFEELKAKTRPAAP